MKIMPTIPGFHAEEIKTDGATIHVRVGGKGPAVVMLHGFGDTGDMWAPVAKILSKRHTIIVPDLRVWASHPIPKAAMTRRRKPATSCEFWTSSRSRRRT